MGLNFEVLQEGQCFYTKGIKKKYGFELEIVLDALTTKRDGELTAKDYFEVVLSQLEKISLKQVDDRLTFTVGQENTTLTSVCFRKGKKRNRVQYWRIVLSDTMGNWPWDKNCSLECREQMRGLFTLYDALNIMNDFFTPESKKFFKYVIWSSDDNVNFLRTCYRQKNNPIPNGSLAETITHVVVCFETEFNPELLNYTVWDIQPDILKTDLKMQISFVRKTSIKEEIEWNKEMGYIYPYVFNLLTRKEVSNDFVSGV